MRKLMILTGFAALACAVGGCEENVQIATAHSFRATPVSMLESAAKSDVDPGTGPVSLALLKD